MALYLFYGSENYLIEKEVNKVVNSLIPKEERELNITTYDLVTTPIEQVIEDAETPPFLAEHKVILAKNAFFFTGQRITKSVDHEFEALDRMIAEPTDFSTIIFLVSYEKLDERKKIVKALKKVGTVKAFSSLSGSDLIYWVKDNVAKQGSKIQDEAAQLLIDVIGKNLQILSQEIMKMATYVGKDGTIDVGVVEELSARTIEQNIFTLIDKVANVKLDEAYQLFYDLLKNKEEPIKMVALFARQFRMMLYAKELNRIGYSNQQIASQIGAHPYVIQLALKQAAIFSDDQLKGILKKLAEVDYQIKTGKMEKVLALEMFMFYLKGLIT